MQQQLDYKRIETTAVYTVLTYPTSELPCESLMTISVAPAARTLIPFP